MRNVKFLPKVGMKYDHSRWGKRVMVLGESHYCADLRDATADLTERVFQRQFDSSTEFEGWMNTYTKFASALSGEQEDRYTCQRVWDEVLYYNFVQEPLTGPRTAPTKEMLVASEPAFWEVLEQYQPDVVLVWGQSRLYDHLPDAGYQGEEVDGVESWVYELKNGKKVKVLPTQPQASPLRSGTQLFRAF